MAFTNKRRSAVSASDRLLTMRRSPQDGFTLTELLIVVAIIGILSAIMIPSIVEKLHKAWLARCMVELRGVQTGLYMVSEPGVLFSTPADFWETVFPASRPGPYYYLVDAGDADAGHGNDLDSYDEDNPGASGEAIDIKFVLICQHDHAHLCKYVYIEDEGPPQLATDDNDPGYDKFIKWEDGRKPTGKPPKPPKPPK